MSTTAIFTTLDAPSKAMRLSAEATIKASSLDWTIVRPTMIYGAPDDRNVARLLKLLRRWPVVPLPGGGKGLHQPVHVEDLARFIVKAINETISVRKIYDIAGPEALTLRQMIEEAGLVLDRRVYCWPVPLKPVVMVARISEKLGLIRIRAEQLERLAEDKVFDISAARDELGYNPRSFRVGIADEAAALEGV